MNKTAENKIKDWFLITRIRILNFIKEHKYVSAAIGIFLATAVIALVVRAATDETISSTPVSVSGENRGITSIVTEAEDSNKTIAPNFSNVIYSLSYSLGEGDSICNNSDDNTSYKADEVVIEATIPLNDNIKWVGSDETAISHITNNTEAGTSTLKVTVPMVNVCSAHSQTLTLQVLNADKKTEIKPTIKIKGGSNGTFVDVPSSFDTITTDYKDEITLKPVVRPGVAKKTNNGRDVMFGILLGFDSNLNTDTISLKNMHLSTSADVTLIATQGTNNESVELYTANTSDFGNKHDGNYYGINNASRHFFASGNMPDLTSTSGKINGLTLIPSGDIEEGLEEKVYSAPQVTMTGDSNIEIEKYPDTTDATYRTSILKGILQDARISLSGGSSVTSNDKLYNSDGAAIDDISLNEIGSYEVRYEVLGDNGSKTTMIRKINIVDPANSSYSLEGAKKVYVETNTSTLKFKELGIYNTQDGVLAVKDTDYTVRYLNGSEEIQLEDMLKTPGVYMQEYTITESSETIKRTIEVVDSLPSVTSEKISVKTANIYNGDTFNDHKVIIGETEAECTNRCSFTQNEDNTYTYVINKKEDSNYITEIVRPINLVPKQYKLSISGITPNFTASRLENNFYAIGAYYVTAKSTRSETSVDDFDVTLRAVLGETQSSATVENKEFASGVDTSAVTNKIYVTENSESVEVTNDSKNNLMGDYFTASMGEDVLLKSTFEYGYDADLNIDELTARIPVNGNLIPIAYSSEITENASSYFGYEIKYNGEKVNEIPGYDIKYYDSEDKEITPETFDSNSQVVSYIIIKITSNKENTFTIKPGTTITLMTKYRVKTFSSTSDVANNLNDLKFNGSATFSWKANEETYTLGSDNDTPYVYITPYKARTTVGIGSDDNYNVNKDITLDASKNDNYTVYASTDVTSPAMNINSNVFGYNRIDSLPIVFELPAGVNYVYNKDYELEPDVTYQNGKTILTYTYDSVEPNSWIEPIYFDFNVDVSAVTGSFEIKVSTGNVNNNDFTINNDVSSIDKYKTVNKNISIVNVEKVSYGQYVYNDVGKYISNIDKEDSFTFSTKLHNNIDQTITDINVYTVLPYIDAEKESSFNGTYEIENLPATAMCTTDDASMVTKAELVGQVNWQPCSDFKKSNNRYSGFTAFKVPYTSLAVAGNAETSIKIYTIGNQPEDVYTFKSFLQYKDSDYISFKDVNLEVISKRITGLVWEDFNVDGIMDDNEEKISNVTLKLYDSSDKLIQSTTPNENGRYTFSGILTGDYYIVADFNTDKYGVTGQPSEDFYDKTRLSVFKAVPITEEEEEIYYPSKPESGDGEELEETPEDDESEENEDNTDVEEEQMSIVKTDTISIEDETRIVRNINLGLSLRKIFGVKVNKYITRAEVTNALGVVTTKDYGNTKLAKLDVKDINNLHIKVVYTLEIENIKYYPGYATLITELVPDGMSFNPDYKENQGWQLQEDGTLTNRTLADQIIDEGEKKYLTVAFDITRKEAGSFVNFASVDELQILGGISDEE